MTATAAPTPAPAASPMSRFERYLTVWVALGILAGVGLGLLAPGVFQVVARLEVAHVNLVVAIFIWVMIYPMMIQIDWSAVKDVGQRPRGLLLTLTLTGSSSRSRWRRSACCSSSTFSRPGSTRDRRASTSPA